ncbi:MAG: DUF4396 domain-containing protein [Actinomycetota bacterium]|nr:DUF4396 domain-containing protein [Actinomycetota bacterium]
MEHPTVTTRASAEEQSPGQGPESSQGMEGMAASATLHCLTGCATGEIVALVVATAIGLGALATIPLALALAFAFGFALSSLPLLRSGLAVGIALKTVVLADTISILTMEVVDNAVVLLIPGALHAGLVNPTFWWSMGLAFLAAYAAAYPVNRLMLRRGQGHARSHGAMGDGVERAWVPDVPAPALAGVLAAFLAGGLLVSIAA